MPLQQFISVIGVVGLLLAVLGWLRRRGWVQGGRPGRSFRAWAWPFGMNRQSRPEAVLKVIERLPLSATHTLLLVRVRDRELLIATHAAGCQVVEGAPAQAIRQFEVTQ